MDAELASVSTQPVAPPSFRTVMRGGGPRFARDTAGPVIAFYVGWKLSGLAAGIGLATVTSLLAWRWERRRDRPGLIARLTLGFVLIQAVIGLLSRSATVYLAQPVLLNGALGLAFVGSVIAGRPLAAMFAGELYEFPPEARASDTFRGAFTRVSLAWGVYMLVRTGVQLLALAVSVEVFLAVKLTGILMSWSVWYIIHCFRGSEEFADAFEVAGPASAEITIGVPAPEGDFTL